MQKTESGFKRVRGCNSLQLATSSSVGTIKLRFMPSIFNIVQRSCQSSEVINIYVDGHLIQEMSVRVVPKRTHNRETEARKKQKTVV